MAGEEQRPQSAHRDLGQLNRAQLIATLAEGLRLSAENAIDLWKEAKESNEKLGLRRANGILQGFAEEEAAKVILLFDLLRCPESLPDFHRRLIKQFDQHLAKLICAYYYNTLPASLAEVTRIVEAERRQFYREGEYGEYILPNHMLYMRERRLYVDYFRNADGSHTWQVPYPPDHRPDRRMLSHPLLERAGVWRATP